MHPKEALIYIGVSISSLIMISYVVHMFIGGIVSPHTEHSIQAAVAALWAVGLGVMAWDIVRRRRSR